MNKTQTDEKITENFVVEVPLVVPIYGPGENVLCTGVVVGGLVGPSVTCLAVEQAGRPSLK